MRVICEELRNLKALTLDILIVTPINKIKITILEPDLSNTKPKLVIVA